MDDAAFLPEHLRAAAAEAGLVQQGRITFARRDVESFALPTPKDDLYGLGFDPDKHAPEFAALREAGGWVMCVCWFHCVCHVLCVCVCACVCVCVCVCMWVFARLERTGA
jgi:hypothetical protein